MRLFRPKPPALYKIINVCPRIGVNPTYHQGTSIYTDPCKVKLLIYVMQHAKTRLFSLFDICHKSTFKLFFMHIDIFVLNNM